jgi:hypothetical protein
VRNWACYQVRASLQIYSKSKSSQGLQATVGRKQQLPALTCRIERETLVASCLGCYLMDIGDGGAADFEGNFTTLQRSQLQLSEPSQQDLCWNNYHKHMIKTAHVVCFCFRCSMLLKFVVFAHPQTWPSPLPGKMFTRLRTLQCS